MWGSGAHAPAGRDRLQGSGLRVQGSGFRIERRLTKKQDPERMARLTAECRDNINGDPKLGQYRGLIGRLDAFIRQASRACAFDKYYGRGSDVRKKLEKAVYATCNMQHAKCNLKHATCNT